MENPESLSHQEAVDGERVLFAKGRLKVTQHRFIVERTVYAMRNITSIQHEIDQPPTPPTPSTPETPPDVHYIILLALGGVTCGFGIAALSEALVGGILLLVVGIVFLAYGVLGSLGRLPGFLSDLHVPPQAPPTPPRPPTPPAKHTVKLTSAAGEVGAFSTTDGELVAEVLSALNQAMVSNRPN